MTESISVTCAIIKRDGKYLITQRPFNVPGPLKWEFPGGKIEEGEDPQQALEREIREELGIKIRAVRVLGRNSHIYGDKHISLEGWVCDHISGEIRKLSINDYAWVKPEKILEYKMMEADLPFVELLHQNYKS
jgi:8-oxo-dGTP diphosphatase